MKKRIFLSFLIPSYHSEKTIEKCVDSILKQDYDNFEILICDQGDTDTSFLLKKSSKIHRIYLEKPSAYRARVELYKKSHGDYVFFPDADDFYGEIFLQKLINIIEGTNYNDLYYYFPSNQTNLKNDFSYEVNVDYQKFIDEFVSTYSHNFISTKCYKKRTDIVFYDVDVIKSSDRLMNICLLKKVKTITKINKVIYNYSINNLSITQNKKLTYVDDLCFSFFEARKFHVSNQNIFKKQLSNLLLGISRMMLEIYILEKQDFWINLKKLSNFEKLNSLYRENIEQSLKSINIFWRNVYKMIINQKFFLLRIVANIYYMFHLNFFKERKKICSLKN